MYKLIDFNWQHIQQLIKYCSEECMCTNCPHKHDCLIMWEVSEQERIKELAAQPHPGELTTENS